MKIIKRIVGSALLVSLVLLLSVTGTYLFVKDATLVPLITDYIGSVSGTRITYDQDATITRTLSPTLHVKNLVVEDENKDFHAHVNSLQFQLSLPSLFLGKFEVPLLALRDTKIEIRESESSGAVTIPESLPLIPVLHDIQVSKMVINHGGKEILFSATHLRELSVNLDPEMDKLVFRVDIDLAGNLVHLQAVLSRIHQTLKSKQLSFTASAKSSNLELSTEGSVDFVPSPPAVLAKVNLQAPDLKNISTGIKDFVIPGSLNGKAEVAGSFDQLAVNNIEAIWKGAGQSQAAVNGDIDDVLALSGCGLKVDSHLEEPAWLSPVLPENMGSLQSADVSVHVSCADKQLALRDVKLEIKTVDELILALVGKLDLGQPDQGGLTPENIDLKLDFSAPTTRTARVLFFDDIWEFGAISGTAAIHSSDGDPAVEDISIMARDAQGIEVDLTGRIAQFPLDPERSNAGYDLDVTKKSKQTSVLAERFDLNLPLAGPLEIKYRIEGASLALQLNKINLTAGEETGVLVAAAGSLHFGNWDLDDPLENIELNFEATSNNIKKLEALLGENIPDFGPLTAEALIHTVSGKHRIDNFAVETVENAAINASVIGSADNVGIFHQPGVNGIQLTAEVAGEDTAHLNNVFGLEKAIPAIGSFQVESDISGSNNEIIISNVSGTAGSEDTLLMEAHGKLGVLSEGNSWQPRETDLSISAGAVSSTSFFNLLGIHLPALGPINASASLKEKKSRVMLETANIAIGDAEAPVLSANGHVYDLFAFKEIDMEVKLNLDGHSFAALSDNITLPDLHPFTGEIIISDSDGTLGIETLHVESVDEKLLSFEVTGLFDDFKSPDTLSLDVRLAAKDLLLIGALFDQQWPAVGPVQLNSRIQKEGKSLEFDTTFTAGKMKIDSEISGLFNSSPPLITGKITAQDFFFPQKAEGENKKDKDKQSKKTHIFSREPIDFKWLKKADVDLSIDIESFNDKWAKSKSAHYEIVGKAMQLKLSPARIIFPRGAFNFDVYLDLNDVPELKIDAYGKDLNPWLALDMEKSGVSKEFAGEMDVDIQVSSSGISQHELASNMQGEVYVNLKNGKMRRALLDLVFLDFVGWSYGKVKRDKYADVQCGVADYSIKDGVISTNALFIDTENISIAGSGTVDLGNEQIDYVFLPKKKSRLIKRADPVNIKGPLNDPSISTLPWKTAATTYGSWFFAPYLFVGIWAADLFTDAVRLRAEKNPCMEYEREHDQKDEAGTQ